MTKSRSAKFRPGVKLNLGGAVIGPGKAELMKKIDALVSISVAAEEMGSIPGEQSWTRANTVFKPLTQAQWIC